MKQSFAPDDFFVEYKCKWEPDRITFYVNDKIIDILGIDEVNAADSSEQKIYDLTGRRVENMKKPGVYIVNGKKIMVK